MDHAPPESIPEIVKLLLGIAGAAIAALGAWLVALTPKFGTKKQNQIDQLQEDFKELRSEAKLLKADVAKLSITVSKQRHIMITRDFAWRQYTWELQRQIMEGGLTAFVEMPVILTTMIEIEED